MWALTVRLARQIVPTAMARTPPRPVSWQTVKQSALPLIHPDVAKGTLCCQGFSWQAIFLLKVVLVVS